MAAITISGKELSKRIYRELKERVQSLTSSLGRAPTLAVVLVGDNPASKVYVGAKTKRAAKLGIDTVDVTLKADCGDAMLQQRLRDLSSRDDVDGILLQLPLPEQLNEFAALTCISPEKDVDGLHPYNQGLLLRDQPLFEPCTPRGCVKLAKFAFDTLGAGEEALLGKHVVIVGRSVLVGKPAAALFLKEHCTVTVCHSRTRDLKSEVSRADIIVAAVGRPHMLGPDWIREGAVVIDVGINRLDDGSLVGDVDFDGAAHVAAAQTPVPGGVGPMTIAMLMENTVKAAASRCES